MSNHCSKHTAEDQYYVFDTLQNKRKSKKNTLVIIVKQNSPSVGWLYYMYAVQDQYYVKCPWISISYFTINN